MKNITTFAAVVLASVAAVAADPAIMVLQVLWENAPGGVSATGFVLQKAAVNAGNTNWTTITGAGAGATNMLVIQPFTALEIDWRIGSTNAYGTSEWAYARSPIPTPGVGEVPKSVLNLRIIRK